MSVAMIEMEYKELLNNLKNSGMTAESVKNDPVLYNYVAEKTVEFLSKVALLSKCNRSLINDSGHAFDIFVGDITMHILKKLDKILACSNKRVISYVVKLVNRQAINVFRELPRNYSTPKQTSEASKNQGNKRARKFRVTFLDDIGWNMIADDTRTEDGLIQKDTMEEDRAMVCQLLEFFCSCSRFQVVSLLATKVLGIKNRNLANAIDAFGLASVSEACFKRTVNDFGISDAYFSNFTHDNVPPYDSLETLSDKISKASYNCKKKLCEKVGKPHVTKKRIRM